jgi:hypothetical protein
MSNNDFLKNTIIFNGVKEFKYNEILHDKDLYSFVNRCILKAPVSLFMDVINENGIIYITSDTELSEAHFELKNVSKELYDKFIERYK